MAQEGIKARPEDFEGYLGRYFTVKNHPPAWKSKAKALLSAYVRALSLRGEARMSAREFETGLTLSKLWVLWSETGARGEGRELGAYLSGLGEQTGLRLPFDESQLMEQAHWPARCEIEIALGHLGPYFKACEQEGLEAGEPEQWPLDQSLAREAVRARAERRDLAQAVAPAALGTSKGARV